MVTSQPPFDLHRSPNSDITHSHFHSLSLQSQWASLKSQEKILASGGSSGPSSLSAGGTPAAYRRASEGGPNLYMKLASKKAAEKNNEI
ncbi:hypothetical protein MTP99_005110 [Tenebrio molitor]|nr:hypothetical protein MTP99_005110 [Tenebrio molitor]